MTMEMEVEASEAAVEAATAVETEAAGRATPKRKNKRAKSKSRPAEQRFTIRKPEWQYLHLKMIFTPPLPNPSPSFPPDLLTWKTNLTSALNQFLGLSGTAISIDFLHLKEDEVWIRIPREDGVRFMAAISGWAKEEDGGETTVGFRVLGSSEFMMGVAVGSGRELFR